MTTCVNCSNPSTYIYEISSVHVIEYCEEHLPRFLNDRKIAGLLKQSDASKAAQAEAFEVLEAKSTKKAAAKKPATTEEEPVSEVVTPTPAE